jgi:hypothetical protein
MPLKPNPNAILRKEVKMNNYDTLYTIREVARLNNMGVGFANKNLVFEYIKKIIDTSDDSLLNAKMSKILANICVYYKDNPTEMHKYIMNEMDKIISDIETENSYNQFISHMEELYKVMR